MATTITRDTNTYRVEPASIKAVSTGGVPPKVGYTVTGLRVGNTYTIRGWARQDPADGTNRDAGVSYTGSGGYSGQSLSAVKGNWYPIGPTDFVATSTSHEIFAAGTSQENHTLWFDAITLTDGDAMITPFASGRILQNHQATTLGPGVLNRPEIIATNTKAGAGPVTSFTTPSLGSLWMPGDVVIIQVVADDTSLGSPAGFTDLLMSSVGGAVGLWTGYRRLQSGDTTWTVTFGVAPDDYSCGLTIIRNVGSITGLGGSNFSAATSHDPSPFSGKYRTMGLSFLLLCATGNGTASTITAVPSGMTELFRDGSLTGGVRNSQAAAAWAYIDTDLDPSAWTWINSSDGNQFRVELAPAIAIDSSPTNYIANSYFVDLTGWSAGP